MSDNISDHDEHKNKNEWKLFLNASLARQSNDAISLRTPKSKTAYFEDGEELFEKVKNHRNYNNVVFMENSVYYLRTANEDGCRISVI